MYLGGIIFVNGMEKFIIFSEYYFLLTAEIIFFLKSKKVSEKSILLVNVWIFLITT